MKIHPIELNPSLITWVLGSTASFLVLASLAGDMLQFTQWHAYTDRLFPFFDLDDEYNIPTFFSVMLLIFAALLLAAVALLTGKRPASDLSKWLILSFGFLCMAYDEAFLVHERLIHPVRSLLGNASLGIFYYAWVIPGAALVCFLALFYLKFLLRLPARTRYRFLLAAMLYLGGCIGFELIGGWYAESNGTKSMTYNLITTIEESLEMGGLVVFIDALLKYLAENYEGVKLRMIDHARVNVEI
jgi:hypothetical protein